MRFHARDHEGIPANIPSHAKVSWLHWVGQRFDIPHAMPSSETLIAYATHGYTFLVSATILLTTVVTFGAPYWYYREYKTTQNRHEPTALSGVISITREIALEKMVEKTEQLESTWKAYQIVSATVLPLMFPMLSSIPLPICSTASIFATLALLSGVISLATCTIYKENIITFKRKSALDIWIQASSDTWHNNPRKSFWIFISLPTVWFASSFAAFVLSIIFSVWERLPIMSATTDVSKVCPLARLSAFKYLTFAILLIALAHTAFVLKMFRSFRNYLC